MSNAQRQKNEFLHHIKFSKNGNKKNQYYHEIYFQ